jgi:hypothetical protein
MLNACGRRRAFARCFSRVAHTEDQRKARNTRRHGPRCFGMLAFRHSTGRAAHCQRPNLERRVPLIDKDFALQGGDASTYAFSTDSRRRPVYLRYVQGPPQGSDSLSVVRFDWTTGRATFVENPSRTTNGSAFLISPRRTRILAGYPCMPPWVRAACADGVPGVTISQIDESKGNGGGGEWVSLGRDGTLVASRFLFKSRRGELRNRSGTEVPGTSQDCGRIVNGTARTTRMLTVHPASPMQSC